MSMIGRLIRGLRVAERCEVSLTFRTPRRCGLAEELTEYGARCRELPGAARAAIRRLLRRSPWYLRALRGVEVDEEWRISGGKSMAGNGARVRAALVGLLVRLIGFGEAVEIAQEHLARSVGELSCPS